MFKSISSEVIADISMYSVALTLSISMYSPGVWMSTSPVTFFLCSVSYLLSTVITSETSLFRSAVCLEDIYFRFNLYSEYATTNADKRTVVAIKNETVSILAEKGKNV